MMMKIASAIFLGWLLMVGPAAAQGAPQTVKLCVPTTGTTCAAVTASAPLPISGSFSATLAGFTPNGNYGTLTATASTSASTALPAGLVVAFQNLSSVDVSCVLASGAATATTNKLIVRGGATVYYTVGSNVNAACINQTGSASNVVAMAGGAGLGTNFGGGGSGGSGGAVTLASGAVASGAYSSGSISSGAFASGSIGSGAVAAGAVSAGAFVSGSVLSGALASGAVVDLTNMSGATAAAVPSKAIYNGVNIGGNIVGLTGLATGATVKAATVAIVDASGNQITSFGGSGGTSSNFGSAFPTAGTAAGVSDGTNMIALRVGTAGTAAPTVLTVQGAASMTPLFVQSATVPASTMNTTSAANLGVASALVFDDISPTSITENNFGYARMSANRNAYQTIRDAAGNERGVNVDASNRLTTAPTMVSGSVASGAYASGSIGSGAVASGAVASGAVSAGALATGAAVDGWDITQGTKTDAPCASGSTTPCSINARLAHIENLGASALPAQTGIGNVNIGAVQSAGSNYETVAASQTAQALGATGATGDYLSHCVIYPASTSPGVVTVFDNTNAAGTNVIAFAGGATSTSNLTPISVPVGAISTAGAWKVTTGANVSVVCYGKFT